MGSNGSVRSGMDGKDRFRLQRWLDLKATDGVIPLTRDEIVTAAKAELGIAVTVCNVEGAMDVVGLTCKRRKAGRKPIGGVNLSRRVAAIEAFLDSYDPSWRGTATAESAGAGHGNRPASGQFSAARGL